MCTACVCVLWCVLCVIAVYMCECVCVCVECDLLHNMWSPAWPSCSRLRLNSWLRPRTLPWMPWGWRASSHRRKGQSYSQSTWTSRRSEHTNMPTHAPSATWLYTLPSTITDLSLIHTLYRLSTVVQLHMHTHNYSSWMHRSVEVELRTVRTYILYAYPFLLASLPTLFLSVKGVSTC